MTRYDPIDAVQDGWFLEDGTDDVVLLRGAAVKMRVPLAGPVQVGGGSETTEALGVTIAPGGADPAPGTLITTQAQATAHGDFATLAAVLDAIPARLRHAVTVTIADGVYTWASLGSWGHLTFGAGGSVVVKAATDLARITGATSTYAVASAIGNQLTLAADPGFAANLVRRKFVRIVSGTGAGQVRPIVSHAGAIIELAGTLAPIADATSVVEFVEPVVEINVDEPSVHLTTSAGRLGWDLTFDGLSVKATNSVRSFQLHGGRTLLRKVIVNGSTPGAFACLITSSGCRVDADDLILDAAETAVFGLTAGGCSFSNATPGWAVLVAGTTFAGILVDAFNSTNGAASNLAFKEVAFADIAVSAIYIFSAQSLISFFFTIVPGDVRADNVGGVLLSIAKGASVDVPAGAVASFPSGTGGDIDLDGTIYTWADVLADPNNVLIGVSNSAIRA